MGLCNLLCSFHHFKALAMLSSALIIIRKCLLSISLNTEILSEESFIDNSGVVFLSISHFFCILHPFNLAFLCHHLPSILSLRGEQCQLNIYIFELATIQSPISYYSSDGTLKMQIFMHEGIITLEITFGAIEGLKLTLDLVELHRQLSVTAQQK